MEFLSDEWFKAANEVLKEIKTDAVDLVIAHVSEKSSHSIVLADGSASVHPGAASAHLTLRMTDDIAEAVRQGSVSALTAIQEGSIVVEGDVGRLLECQEALAAVDQALISVM